MKTEVEDHTIVESNTEVGGSVEMGVSARAMAHITRILTKLYNDPESAVFREYVANGLDAHAVVGNTDPVEVWLPTDESPMFMVVDHGVGMSQETVELVLSQYGESLKNQSNDEIGGFGLGFKSGLALAVQFTVSTVKDGKRTVAVVHNVENGLPRLDWLPVTDTEDPDGTTISVPVPNPSSFTSKAYEYLPFFKPGSVVIANADYAATNFMTHYRELFNEVFFEEFNGSSISVFDSTYADVMNIGRTVRIVMGGIVYNVSQEELRVNLTEDNKNIMSALDRNGIVIDSPIGSVTLSPSREGIQFDERTVNFINDMIIRLFDGLVSSAISEAKGKDGLIETLDYLNTLSEGVAALVAPKLDPIGEYSFEDFVGSNFISLNLSNQVSSSYNYGYNYDNDISHADTRREDLYNSRMGTSERVILVKGDVSSVPYARRILSTYMTKIEPKTTRTYFLLIPEDPAEDFFTVDFSEGRYGDYNKQFVVSLDDLKTIFGVRVIEFSDLKTQVLKYRKDNPSPKSKKKHSELSVPVSTFGSYNQSINVDDLVDTVSDYENIFVVQKNGNFSDTYFKAISEAYNIKEDSFALVQYKSTSSKAIFSRLKKGSVGYKELDYKIVDRVLFSFVPKFTAKDIEKSLYTSVFKGRVDFFSSVADSIKDPQLKACVKSYTKITDIIKYLQTHCCLVDPANLKASDAKLFDMLANYHYTDSDDQESRVYNKYPLLKSINFDRYSPNFNATVVQDIVQYINTKHRSSKTKIY